MEYAISYEIAKEAIKMNRIDGLILIFLLAFAMTLATLMASENPVPSTAGRQELGFSSVIAIAGLLAVAYLVLRQRN
jgi:hypothetical protein